MGSRAVVVVGRDPEAVARRFGFSPEEVPHAGIVLTRRGRRFFDDAPLEAAFLERVRKALTQGGVFDTLESDWVILDAELMPWSAKARALLEAQYAPVGRAAKATLGASVAVLEQAQAAGAEVAPLLQRSRQRLAAAEGYVTAYRRYCWATEGVDGLKLAPFHVLASEGAVHADKPHRWHLDTLAAASATDPEWLVATAHRFVALDDDDAVAQATSWWEALTEGGGEGMVVKPATFVAWRGRRLVQPALKCRGREYLRIVYGPEYTRPELLSRLKERGLGRKRSLAAREFVLGLEALHRFVEGRGLHAVHSCVFAILALESEPVDPRL